MAPNKRKRAPTSATRREEAEEPVRWNHKDGTHFTEPNLIVPYGVNIETKRFIAHDRYQPVREGGLWNDTNKVLYNGWLRIRFTTQISMDYITLEKMGIDTPVEQMFERIGIHPPSFCGGDIYRELSCQFLSSVELHHRPNTVRSPQTAYITFALRGKTYELTIPKLCKAFMLDENKRGCELPSIDIKPLWKAIGSEEGRGREQKLTLIRNPAIRLVAKILGTHFMGKSEAGSVTKTELTLLYYCLPREIRAAIYTPEVEASNPPTLETNLGYIFAEILVEKRTRGLLINKAKTEPIANALTMIFQEAEVPLDGEKHEKLKQRRMNRQYLRDIRFLKGDGYHYEYTRADGVVRTVNLPLPYELGIETLDDLMFEVPQHLQIETQARKEKLYASSALPDRSLPNTVISPFQSSQEQEDFPTEATLEDELDIIAKSQTRNHLQRKDNWASLLRYFTKIDPRNNESTGGAAATGDDIDS